MDTLSPHQAREVVEMVRRTAIYYEDKGAQCPLCGAWNRIKSMNRGIRYHFCSRCWHKYRSIDATE